MPSAHERMRPFDGAAREDPWRELVRLTLLAFWPLTVDAGPGAALLGLAMVGDHTYREAALLLDMEAG